jgi:hypothetical protein
VEGKDAFDAEFQESLDRFIEPLPGLIVEMHTRKQGVYLFAGKREAARLMQLATPGWLQPRKTARPFSVSMTSICSSACVVVYHFATAHW